jgi:putative lipoprotein
MMSIRSLTLAAVGLCVVPRVAHADDRADDWFGRDKALHFGASAIISSTAYGVTTAFDDRRSVAFIVGGSVALTAGLAKEGYDALGYGTPSWKDLAWDVAGTLVGLGIAYGVDAIFRREPTRTTSTALVRF